MYLVILFWIIILYIMFLHLFTCLLFYMVLLWLHLNLIWNGWKMQPQMTLSAYEARWMTGPSFCITRKHIKYRNTKTNVKSQWTNIKKCYLIAIINLNSCVHNFRIIIFYDTVCYAKRLTGRKWSNWLKIK